MLYIYMLPWYPGFSYTVLSTYCIWEMYLIYYWIFYSFLVFKWIIICNRLSTLKVITYHSTIWFSNWSRGGKRKSFWRVVSHICIYRSNLFIGVHLFCPSWGHCPSFWWTLSYKQIALFSFVFQFILTIVHQQIETENNWDES